MIHIFAMMKYLKHLIFMHLGYPTFILKNALCAFKLNSLCIGLGLP